MRMRLRRRRTQVDRARGAEELRRDLADEVGDGALGGIEDERGHAMGPQKVRRVEHARVRELMDEPQLALGRERAVVARARRDGA